jgi:hypothetical protein
MPEVLSSLCPAASNGTAPKISIFAGHDAAPMMPIMVVTDQADVNFAANCTAA